MATASPRKPRIPVSRKRAVMYAIWMCATNRRLKNETIIKRAAQMLQLDPKHLFDGFNDDWFDRAWCSRPVDWNPMHILGRRPIMTPERKSFLKSEAARKHTVMVPILDGEY